MGEKTDHRSGMIFSFRRRIINELMLALLFVGVFASILIYIDFFDWWYTMTRAHEDWELDEILPIIMSMLLAGTIISFRHFYLLKCAFKELSDAKQELSMQISLKNRHEKLIALGELSSGLAHEINNALQPVLGLSEILKLRLKETDAELSDYMEILEDSALHARGIVRGVLSFARNKEAEFEKSHAIRVFEESILFAKSLLPTSVKIDISRTLNPGNINALLMCDKTGIAQVFVNIFQNSAHAMDEKGTITVDAEQRNLTSEEADLLDLPTGEYVIIHIIDTGCGMDEKTLENLFNPFYTTKDEGEGTGLGMAMVYGILKQHAGAVYPDSELGEGSVFSLFFPVAEHALSTT